MTPSDPDRRPPLVPSHIAWPAFVVFLLLMSITMAVYTMYAATADGGVRLVDTSEPAPGVVTEPEPPEPADSLDDADAP